MGEGKEHQRGIYVIYYIVEVVPFYAGNYGLQQLNALSFIAFEGLLFGLINNLIILTFLQLLEQNLEKFTQNEDAGGYGDHNECRSCII